jgi:hypothetical protein
MDEGERRAKYHAQTEELYASIGRFAVKFEHVTHAMQRTVDQLLARNGLRHAGLANAILSGLTADLMLSIYRAAVMELRKDVMDDADVKIFKKVVNRIRTLIETRNDIIHRLWFVGWAAPEDQDFSTVTSWKFKNTSAGAEFRPLDFTKDDFNRHAAEAEELARVVNRMTGCLLIGTNFTKNFRLDEEGEVRVPGGG